MRKPLGCDMFDDWTVNIVDVAGCAEIAVSSRAVKQPLGPHFPALDLQLNRFGIDIYSTALMYFYSNGTFIQYRDYLSPCRI